jgi:hypothetical protein
LYFLRSTNTSSFFLLTSNPTLTQFITACRVEAPSGYRRSPQSCLIDANQWVSYIADYRMWRHYIQ